MIVIMRDSLDVFMPSSDHPRGTPPIQIEIVGLIVVLGGHTSGVKGEEKESA
jgi:hypothetical protein